MSIRSSPELNSPDSNPDKELLNEVDGEDTIKLAEESDKEHNDPDMEINDDLPEPSVTSSPASPILNFAVPIRNTDEVEPQRESSLQLQQQEDSKGPEKDENDSLQELTWTELHERFVHEMDIKSQDEHATLALLNHLIKYYTTWAQASATQERERAAKRLRTRITYVHYKEQELENKRVHHSNVVKAFEDALYLLRAT